MEFGDLGEGVCMVRQSDGSRRTRILSRSSGRGLHLIQKLFLNDHYELSIILTPEERAMKKINLVPTLKELTI